MLINRNNYETFFLLYADDELRTDERKVVEDFVAENEDLKGEINMLLSAILPAEEIVLTDKSFLYRDIVFDAALQEKLLLKIDNELSSSELRDVNNILATDDAALQEYNSLLGTKLNENDKIVFDQKHLLYKKEKDNVIAFGWLRWAAAAVLIGFGLFFGVSLFNKKEITNAPFAVNKLPKNKGAAGAPIIADTQISKALKTTTATNTNSSKNINPPNKEPENIASVKKEKIKNIVKQKNIIIDPKEEVTLALNRKTEPALTVQKIIPAQKTTNETAAINTNEKTKTALVAKNIVALENTYAKGASYTEDEKSENKIFYIDEDEIKRSKVGGFFKKVKRLVERTAKIKTGNSISIAGFEIASK